MLTSHSSSKGTEAKSSSASDWSSAGPPLRVRARRGVTRTHRQTVYVVYRPAEPLIISSASASRPWARRRA